MIKLGSVMKGFSIIISVLLLLSCGNMGKREYSPMIEDNNSEEMYEKCDTNTPHIKQDTHTIEEKISVSSNHSSSSSSRSHSSNSYDNMRGFDPASEDDMEDNGMSRYMENNDEEGWDLTIIEIRIMRHRIKAGKVGSFAPEKQKVEIEQLENREVADEVEEIFEEDSELSNDDEALAAMEFYDSPDEME